MTQSDSPDFEFDISDLEVEREESAPSMDGKNMSKVSDGESVSVGSEVADHESIKPDSDEDFEADDRELDVFEIDDLPSSEDESAASKTDLVSPVAEPSVGSEIESPAASEEDSPETGSVQRVEEKAAPVPSRVLGEDDLGADVFAEIEADLGDSLGLSDVIDDLMEEVDDFEAGGFVELDEKDGEETSSSDGFFKMEDPDDSLQNSVDPDREEEVPSSPASAFPSPPSDFEIPADPEPEAKDAAAEVAAPAVESAAQPMPEVSPDVEDVEEESVLEADPIVSPKPEAVAAPPAPDLSQFEIPADPPAAPEPMVEPPVREDPLAEESAVVSEPAKEPVEPIAAAVAEIPEEEPAVEPVVDESATAPVEGHEKVLFSAAEEVPPEIPEDDLEAEDVSDLLASVAEEDVASESVEENGSEAEVEDVEAVSQLGNEDSSEVTETESVVAQESAEIEAEVEEDLSDLLDVLDEDDVGNEEVEVPQTSAMEEPEAAEVPEEDSGVSEEDAEEPVSGEESIPGLVEVSEDEEDISELLASAGAEAEESTSNDDPEAAEEVPGLGEVEEEGIPGLQEAPEEAPAEDEAIAEASAGSEEPGLVEIEAELDEEDISSLIGSANEENSTPEEPVGPSLGVIDDDDAEAEAVELPTSEVPGLVEVEDEALDEGEEPTSGSAAPAVPSAEELLMRAGSLLSGESEKPAAGASALLDELEEDDDEEVISMPSPDAMIADAADSDDEVVQMPDPLSLIAQEGEAIAVIHDGDDEEIPAPGNVADRAGDLPPPPPAPVEILDQEAPEEDTQADVSEVESVSTVPDDEGALLEDPFASEISLDDFNEGLGALEGLEDDDSDADGVSLDASEFEAEAKQEVITKVVEMPKPSLLWRITHSMAIAAGLVLVGLAGVLAVWKQEIVEYYDGRDIDGSALLLEIEEIGTHALSEFDKNGLYRMQWVDSEVRRVSENEIRLYAVVGAQLRENLYTPVLESRLNPEIATDEAKLTEMLRYARDHFPEEIGNYPDRPWDRLYEISAKKEEVLPLRVTYGLKRETKEDDWKLARIKVSGYKGDLEWPEGDPKHVFGENAYDVNSLEFAKVYSDYSAASGEYIARIDRMRAKEEDGLLALKRENESQRERVRMALAEGSFFNGLAIVGEDGAESHDVQLVITEVRDGGGFVKGVVKLAGEKQERSKYFVGSLEFEKTMSGREQGYLSLKTVSIGAPDALSANSPFFEADNVSRMRLRADGFKLEGDSRDLSFRLTRSL